MYWENIGGVEVSLFGVVVVYLGCVSHKGLSVASQWRIMLLKQDWSDTR